MAERDSLDWAKHLRSVGRGQREDSFGQVAAMLPVLQGELDHIKTHRENSLDNVKGIILSLLGFLEAMAGERSDKDLTALTVKQTELLVEYLKITQQEETDEQTEASDNQIAFVEKMMGVVQATLA